VLMAKYNVQVSAWKFPINKLEINDPRHRYLYNSQEIEYENTIIFFHHNLSNRMQ
jgi:hypothetical protein